MSRRSSFLRFAAVAVALAWAGAAGAVTLSPKGTNDMTRAFAEAFGAIQATGGGEVRLTRGIYHFYADRATPCKIPKTEKNVPAGIVVRGVPGVSIVGNGSAFVFHGAMAGIVVEDCSLFRMKGFAIDVRGFSETQRDANRPAVWLRASSDVVLEDVTIHQSMGAALRLDDCTSVTWRGSSPNTRQRLAGVFPIGGRPLVVMSAAVSIHNLAGRCVFENAVFEGMLNPVFEDDGTSPKVIFLRRKLQLGPKVAIGVTP